MNIKKRTLSVLAIGTAASLALSACSSVSDPSESANSEKLTVLASFYPLQFVTSQVGGDLVSVESLTPQGAEPHDLELSPAHTRKISQADLVVYQSSFQKAVDEAIEARKPEHVYDAAVHAQGVPAHDHSHDESGLPSEEDHAAEDHTTEGHAEDDHADHEHHEDETAEEHAAHANEHEGETEQEHAAHSDTDSHDGHDHGPNDPHFWLDPELLAATATDIAHELSEIDPENTATYTANATKLVENLTALDQAYATGLGDTCTNRTVVVTHEAFGYLAGKYHFDQMGISGIDPEGEPSPAKMREIRAQIQDAGITTIFFETLTSPKVAQTLAKDLGIQTAVLDPLEGLVDQSQDYFSVMEANLAALKQGMNCA